MFVESIKITETATCIFYEENVTVTAQASAALTEVLPYMNSVMGKARYRPDADILSFRKGKKLFTIDGGTVTITRLLNTTEAYEEIDWLKDVINDIHTRKGEITPSFKPARHATALDVYRNLPKTNCMACGVSGCMAFANQLYKLERDVEDCPVLTEEAHRAKRAKLLRML